MITTQYPDLELTLSVLAWQVSRSLSDQEIAFLNFFLTQNFLRLFYNRVSRDLHVGSYDLVLLSIGIELFQILSKGPTPLSIEEVDLE